MDRIRLAYSPDTDDAFMVEALRSGQVTSENFDLEYTKADIQTLNEAARECKYDITAISAAAYPHMAKDYWMMPVGASVGDRFGPAIVVSDASGISGTGELKGKRVATPGSRTTAFYSAWDLFGPFEAVHMEFEEISAAVLSGEVDAGILIHELQMNCEDDGLKKIGDLGLLWYERYQLPLPLGVNAIARRLGMTKIQELTRVYKDSISYGIKHKETLLPKAVAATKPDLPAKLADDYIKRYVNHRSLELHSDVKKAIQKLFEIGSKAGLCPDLEGDQYLYQ